MSIRVECDECYHEFRARDEHAGRRVRCPECDAPVQIPSSRSSRSRGGSGASRHSRSRGRSSGRKAASGSLPVWVWAALGGGGVVIVALVCVLIFSGNGDDSSGDQTSTVASNSDTNQSSTNTDSGASTNQDTNQTPGNTTTTNQPNNSGLVSQTSTSPIGNDPNQTTIGSTAPSAGTGNSTTPSTTTTPSAPSANTPSTTAANTPPADPVDRKPFENLADLIEVVEPSVVRIDVEEQGGRSNGSGFVIDAQEGLAVTNHHVMAGAVKAFAVFHDSDERYPITHFSKPDSERDLCVIKINCPAEKLHALPVAKKSRAKVRTWSPSERRWASTSQRPRAF